MYDYSEARHRRLASHYAHMARRATPGGRLRAAAIREARMHYDAACAAASEASA